MNFARAFAGAALVVQALILSACAGTAAKTTDVKNIAAAAAGPSLGKIGLLPSSGVKLPQFQKRQLANGVTLLLAPKRDVPLISVTAVVRGGSVADPAGKAGLASLTASLLERGAGGRSAAEFAEAVDAAGGNLSASAGLESVTIRGEFLAEDQALMLELLGDMLVQPRFAADEFDKLRQRFIEFIKAAKDGDPRGLMASYGAAFLFEGHPYGRPSSGDEASLGGLTLMDVQQWYRQHMGADRLIVSIVGDFDEAALVADLEKRLGDWRAASGVLPEVPAAPKQAGGRVLLIDKPGATQSYFWLGNVGVARDYDKRAALDLTNTLFGGRFGSMLNRALRQDSGLTYGARSVLQRPREPGSLALSSYTATPTTAEAIDLAVATLGKMREEGFDEQLIISGQNYILGQDPLRLETAARIAAQLASLEFYGSDRSYIDDYARNMLAVDREAVREVINEVYPRPDNLVYVILGDASQIRDVVAKYGDVTELSITEPRFAPR